MSFDCIIGIDEKSITCLHCGMTSYHPEDVKHGFCGKCHRWHSTMHYEISKEEALDRMALYDPIEVRFECEPNDGITELHSYPREQLVRLIEESTGTFVSGSFGQSIDFGIYVWFHHHQKGLGYLYLQTRPERRVAPEELARQRHGLLP